MSREATGSDFRVKLSGLKLPPDVEKRIAIEIRRVLLHELASIDLHGDLRISPSFALGNGTQGIEAEVIRR